MPKVLVADDSMAVRKVAERHLTQAGLDVTLAASGEEAVALLAHERPDLIICDVIMPDKSGYDVCTFTRSQATLAGTPVLLISGIVNADVTRQAESCGANGVLKKPFQGSMLQDRVLELLGHPPGAGTDDAPAPDASSPSYRHAQETAPTRPVDPFPALVPARAGHAQPRPEPAELQDLRSRVDTLESVLATERAAATRLTEQLDQASEAARRVYTLEDLLEREREKSAQMSRRRTDNEQTAGRVEELETLLARECERTAQLNERLSAAEQGAGRVEELETLLATECERNAQLQEQLTDAKHRAAEAAAREDALARKLSQIASLSS